MEYWRKICLLLNFQDGEYSELAIPMIAEAFSELRGNGDTKSLCNNHQNSENDHDHVHIDCIKSDRIPALVYGDEDVARNGKRQNPWFKPDWSPDYLPFRCSLILERLLQCRLRK